MHFYSGPSVNFDFGITTYFEIANGDEFHRALLCKAQQSINNNLIILIVQNQTYRGRQGRVNSELTFDLSDIY